MKSEIRNPKQIRKTNIQMLQKRFFGVYLLIRKRAVLRESAAGWRFTPAREASELPSRANSVSLLANRWIF